MLTADIYERIRKFMCEYVGVLVRVRMHVCERERERERLRYKWLSDCSRILNYLKII